MKSLYSKIYFKNEKIEMVRQCIRNQPKHYSRLTAVGIQITGIYQHQLALLITLHNRFLQQMPLTQQTHDMIDMQYLAFIKKYLYAIWKIIKTQLLNYI